MRIYELIKGMNKIFHQIQVIFDVILSNFKIFIPFKTNVNKRKYYKFYAGKKAQKKTIRKD